DALPILELDSDAFGDRGSLGGAHVQPHSAGVAEGVASDTCDEVLSTGAVQARAESGSGARAIPSHAAGSGHIFQTVRAAVRASRRKPVVVGAKRRRNPAFGAHRVGPAGVPRA